MAGAQHGSSDGPPDTGEFEWHTKADSGSAGETARKIGLRSATVRVPTPDGGRARAGLIAAILFVVLSTVILPGSSVAHTTFTANDVSVTGDSGQLTSLTIAPEGDVHYNGLETEPSEVEVTVSAKLASESTWESVGTTSLSATGREGSVNFSFSEIDLLTATSMTQSDFAATDGSTSSTDVDVRVTATLVGAGPGGSNVTATSTDTMTVTVDNEAANADAGGKANSGGSAA